MSTAQEAIQATQAFLAAMGCKPEDEDYKQQFTHVLAEERKRIDAAAAEEQKRIDAAEERKLALEERKLEAEERKLELEAEERRRVHDAEQQRLVREHELLMSQQQNTHRNSTQPDGNSQQHQPPPRVFIDILPFAPANERADRFIRRLETVLAREKVPKERFAEQLLKALPPPEAAPLLEVPVEEQFDYEIL